MSGPKSKTDPYAYVERGYREGVETPVWRPRLREMSPTLLRERAVDYAEEASRMRQLAREPSDLGDLRYLVPVEKRDVVDLLWLLDSAYWYESSSPTAARHLSEAILHEAMRMQGRPWDVFEVVLAAVHRYGELLGVDVREMPAAAIELPEPVRQVRGPDLAPRRRRVRAPEPPRESRHARRLRRRDERQRTILDLLRGSSGLSKNEIWRRMSVGRAEFEQAFEPLTRGEKAYLQDFGTKGKPSWRVVRPGYPTSSSQKGPPR